MLGQCDDGRDDSLSSPTIANKSLLSGIVTISKIQPVQLQVALKKGSEAQNFTFSRIWYVPRTVLRLYSGRLAFMNIDYVVADADLASEGLLIGRPVHEHMRVDTKTLLGANSALLDITDCSGL